MNFDSNKDDINFEVIDNMFPDMMPSMMNPIMQDMDFGGTAYMCPFMGCMPMVHDVIEDDEDIMEDTRGQGYDTVPQILNQIERNNPQVFRMMRMYGIPLNTARIICRRIIRLTLMYRN